MALNMGSAMDVHKYYGGSGSFADRRKTWQDLGLGDAASYQGTAVQNAQLVSAMKDYNGLTRPAQTAPAATPVTSTSPSPVAQPAASSSSPQASVTELRSRSDELQRQLAAIAPFTYDKANDPAYQAYSAQYERNARRAMEDTLAQVAARTGGLASSYAGAAAQQQYQRYMTDLDNIVPQLEQIAYDRYRDTQNDLQKQITTQRSIEQSEYKNLADLIESTGYQPTAEELYAAGMTSDRARALRQTYLLAQEAAAAKAKSSGSSSSGSGTPKKAADTTKDKFDVSSEIQKMKENDEGKIAKLEQYVDDGTITADEAVEIAKWNDIDLSSNTKVTLSETEKFYKNNPAKFLEMFGVKRFREVYGAKAETYLRQLNK